MKQKLKDFILMTIGTLFVAINIHFFLSPNNLAPGGISGLSIVLKYFLPNISIGFLMIFLNVILFIIGYIFIGKGFGIKTMYASFSLSFMVWAINEWFPIHKALSQDIMIQLIVGSILASIGMAMVFNQKASTGGMDIIAMIVNKYSSIDMGKAVLLSNLLIVLLSSFIFGVQSGMYAFLGVIIKGWVIDYVLHILNENKEIVIISDKSDDVREFIVHVLGRGATIHTAKGGFSQNDKEVITTILSGKELMKLKHFIAKTGKGAFVTVHNMYEIMGHNFESFA